MQAAHHTRCLIKADIPTVGPLLCPSHSSLALGSQAEPGGEQQWRGRCPASHLSCMAAPLSAYSEHLTHFNYGPADTSGRARDDRDSLEAPALGGDRTSRLPGAPSPPASTSPPWISPRRPLLPPGALWPASVDSAGALGRNGPGAACGAGLPPAQSWAPAWGSVPDWGLGGDARRAGNTAPTRPIPMYI